MAVEKKLEERPKTNIICSSLVSFNVVLCLLQDFEALTPNLLARTVETVEGGGIVVILLRTMKSLKQLYTMTMVGRWVLSLYLILNLLFCCIHGPFLWTCVMHVRDE